MEKRISIISIIVEDTSVSGEINDLLHQFGNYIVGRMGIPYRERGISIICVVMEAPGDVISSLAGKLGMIKGVSIKTVISKTSV
jgi:putative iron-only hydrogenase system regulator